MNRNGQAMVVWAHSQSPVDWTVPDELHAVYIEGTANQPAALVATRPADLTGIFVRAAIDGSGNGLIVWGAPDTTVGKDSIWASTFAKQDLGPPALVESYDAGDADLPAVAMNAAGQGIVVWRQDSAAATEVYGRRYAVTGSWVASPDLVHRSNSSYDMAVALDLYGTAKLALARGNNVGVQATYLAQAVGASWTSVESLESDDLAIPAGNYTYIEPLIALDGNGDTLVGWRKKTGDNEFVPHFRWRMGGTWGQDLETGKVLDLFSTGMRMAVSDDGRAIAVWSYYHCDPTSTHASDVCPKAKDYASLSPAALAAIGSTYAVVYR
jgi:hypothetical protein